MSNYHRPTAGTVERREKGHSGKLTRACPMQFVNYNPGMAGTDSFGRRRLRYTSRRISKKWWRGLYYWVLDTSLTNGYVAYCFFFRHCGCAGKPMKFSMFVQQVYGEGLKELGYDLKLVKLRSSSNKYVIVNDGDNPNPNPNPIRNPNPKVWCTCVPMPRRLRKKGNHF